MTRGQGKNHILILLRVEARSRFVLCCVFENIHETNIEVRHECSRFLSSVAPESFSAPMQRYCSADSYRVRFYCTLDLYGDR